MVCESLSGKIFQGTRDLGTDIYLYHSFTSRDCKILFHNITRDDPVYHQFSIDDLNFLKRISKEEEEK